VWKQRVPDDARVSSGFGCLCLTTFSIANDVAKYFAIIPAAFATTYPALNALNIMKLASPESLRYSPRSYSMR